MSIHKLGKSVLILGAFFFSSQNASATSGMESELVKKFENEQHQSGYRESIEDAYQFLYRQMDQFHNSLIIYDEPDFSAYYLSGFMGADKALDVDIYDSSAPRLGKTSLRIHYDFRKDVRQGWAGIYFQYPDKNWGGLPGRSLVGAKQLSFYVRADDPISVQFKMGGINQFPYYDPSKAYQDSLKPLWVSPQSRSPSTLTTKISIEREWQQYIVDLTGIDPKNLESVIGVLAIIIDRDDRNPENTLYVDNIIVEMDEHWGKRLEPRFIQSYVIRNYHKEEKRPVSNTAHIYDQALALLAFMAMPVDENLRRARLIANALVITQNNDRCFGDGRLRNAYASGDLLAPLIKFKAKVLCDRKHVKQAARIPGVWNKKESKYEEDAYSTGSDVGNNAWAGIALIQAYEILVNEAGRRNEAYLKAAQRIGNWIVDNYKQEEIAIKGSKGDVYGGFSGGLDYRCNKLKQCSFVDSKWRSTEHNIDLFVLFSHLVRIDKKHASYWQQNAHHALAFVNRMLNREGYFHTGVTETTGSWGQDKVAINCSVIPIDAQSWAALAFNDKIDPKLYPNLSNDRLLASLRWALEHCGDTLKGERYQSDKGYDFNCRGDSDGSWWEGTAQLAAALQQFDTTRTHARTVLAKVARFQIKEGSRAQGAILAASKDRLTTGFTKWWGEWTYPDDPHIGATAWYLFAALNKNPYYLER